MVWYGMVWDKLLKSRRGCLEKLRPGESLKPRGFWRQTRGFAWGKHRGIQALPRERFFRQPQGFGFLEVQGPTQVINNEFDKKWFETLVKTNIEKMFHIEMDGN